MNCMPFLCPLTQFTQSCFSDWGKSRPPGARDPSPPRSPSVQPGSGAQSAGAASPPARGRAASESPSRRRQGGSKSNATSTAASSAQASASRSAHRSPSASRRARSRTRSTGGGGGGGADTSARSGSRTGGDDESLLDNTQTYGNTTPGELSKVERQFLLNQCCSQLEFLLQNEPSLLPLRESGSGGGSSKSGTPSAGHTHGTVTPNPAAAAAVAADHSHSLSVSAPPTSGGGQLHLPSISNASGSGSDHPSSSTSAFPTSSLRIDTSNLETSRSDVSNAPPDDGFDGYGGLFYRATRPESTVAQLYPPTFVVFLFLFVCAHLSLLGCLITTAFRFRLDPPKNVFASVASQPPPVRRASPKFAAARRIQLLVAKCLTTYLPTHRLSSLHQRQLARVPSWKLLRWRKMRLTWALALLAHAAFRCLRHQCWSRALRRCVPS